MNEEGLIAVIVGIDGHRNKPKPLHYAVNDAVPARNMGIKSPGEK